MDSPGNRRRNRNEALAKAGEPFLFKPGQSGNLNGRPKRKSLRSLLKHGDEHVAKELIRCMKSEDIEQALQAILLYARFRHAEEWRAGEVQQAQSVAASISMREPDITAEQRRAVIRYVTEQLTLKEVEGAAGQPQIANRAPPLLQSATAGRSDTGAAAAPPTPIQFGNWVPEPRKSTRG